MTVARLFRLPTRLVATQLIVDHGRAAAGADGPVVVHPVWKSRCFALAIGSGAPAPGSSFVDVRVLPLPVLTERQQVLLDMAWTERRPLLYQPVAFPEVESWPLVRQCSDRLGLMTDFLDARGVAGTGRSYLDLACNYGWFVDAFRQLGFDSRGVELDRRAPRIAELAYGLAPDRIVVDDLVRFLTLPDHQADVMSCFSFVHHLVAAGHTPQAEDVVRFLAARSGLGFFFDTGESHESWLSSRLPGWTADSIERWLAGLCPGMTVTPLGTDRDARGEWRHQYGRTTFAVWRH